MKAWLRNTRDLTAERPGTIALALLGAGVLLVGIKLVDGARAELGDGRGKANERKTIATATSNGLRVKLIAERDPSEDPPLATARISAFERSGGEWDRLGRPQVVGSNGAWFWRVVTRRHGVRQLDLRIPGGRFPLRVGVRLLQSASLGPSARFLFVVDNGRLMAVDV